MFDFLKKHFMSDLPKKTDASSADIKKDSPKPNKGEPQKNENNEPLPKEPEHKAAPSEQNPSSSNEPTYEQSKKYFPKLLSLIADHLEKQIPGDEIPGRNKYVLVSMDVYKRYIDKIYFEINQASDGHMTLKLSAGKRGTDKVIGNYFFEAGSTKEEIFSFLRSAKMPDILDKTIDDLETTFMNR